MQKALNSIGKAVDIFTSLLLLALTVTLLIGIFYRYILHAPLFWSDVLATNFFTWFLFMGTSIVVRRRAMFRVELLSEHFSPRLKKWHRVFVSLVCIATYAIVAYYGWELTKTQVSMRLIAFPALFPLVNFAWIYISIPVAFVFMIIEEANILRLTLVGGEQTPAASGDQLFS